MYGTKGLEPHRHPGTSGSKGVKGGEGLRGCGPCGSVVLKGGGVWLWLYVGQYYVTWCCGGGQNVFHDRESSNVVASVAMAIERFFETAKKKKKKCPRNPRVDVVMK